MTDTDTIVAVATPPGQGAIGIVRLSGLLAKTIFSTLFSSVRPDFIAPRPYRLHHGRLHTPSGAFLDEVLAVYMPAPATFTGEDVVEFHGHGGPTVLRSVVEACVKCGARTAEPGEFSKRAVLNGRMDLTQAEAVMEIIGAQSQAAVEMAGNKLSGILGQHVSALRTQLEALRIALCVAVDFPEDELDCLAPSDLDAGVDAVQENITRLIGSYERNRCWREGALVVLAGQVNAGKSSLMNAILGVDRAIVTDIPGTTRDYLEESVLIEGLPVRLVDTAGLRAATDAVERLGVERSRELLSQADLILLLIDAELGPGAEDIRLAEEFPGLLVVANKIDLLRGNPAWPSQKPWSQREFCAISAKQAQGLEKLLATIRGRLAGATPRADELVPNVRQHEALIRANAELAALRTELAAGIPYDLLALRLDTTCAILAELTGAITPQAVLDKIFDGFCIGK